jgi:hypothetical protein
MSPRRRREPELRDLPSWVWSVPGPYSASSTALDIFGRLDALEEAVSELKVTLAELAERMGSIELGVEDLKGEGYGHRG